ncbi:MAG: NADH:ubiquinone reductase (Na(+)-transporting) subunit C [Bacteroidia bacterium]|nr:MAG: NADH:ubiquinone reductase (Na(+)-transporting) subunit C [Bacteroidia bacterium]
MRNFSNRYIFIFATVMVAIVAFVLSSAALFLQPMQERNAEIEKKRNILASVGIEATGVDAEELYSKYVTSSFVINDKAEVVEGVDAFGVEVKKEQRKPIAEQVFPIYIATFEDGHSSYIMPLEWKGLWGPIYGYLSLKEDLRTISGVTFDHKSETPGLGAEINTTAFESQFVDKQLFTGDEFTGILVQKGGAAPGDMHAVDAISGGTITSKALEAMIYNCLKNYVNYLKNNSN